jgi:hypothetical protein
MRIAHFPHRDCIGGLEAKGYRMNNIVWTVAACLSVLVGANFTSTAQAQVTLRPTQIVQPPGAWCPQTLHSGCFGPQSNISGGVAMIASNHNTVNVFGRDATGTFRFTQALQSPALGEGLSESFGSQIDFDSRTAIIASTVLRDGAWQEDRVYVFRRVAGKWVYRQTLPIPLRSASSEFQFSVRRIAVEGAIAIVSVQTLVPIPDTGGGLDQQPLVFAFARSRNGMFLLQTTLQPRAGIAPNASFYGLRMALDGNTVFIYGGAPTSDEDASVVHVFKQVGRRWFQLQTLRASNYALAPGSLFGLAIALDGDTAAIAAPFTGPSDFSGVVDIFARRFGQWHRIQRLTNPAQGGIALPVTERVIFGTSLALDRGSLLISSDLSTPAVPPLFLFRRQRDLNKWLTSATLEVGASGLPGVNLSGSTALIAERLAVNTGQVLSFNLKTNAEADTGIEVEAMVEPE